MAIPLKEYFNPTELKRLAKIAGETDSSFNEKAFLKAVTGNEWEQLELKQRARRVSTELGNFLKGNYAVQCRSVKKIAPHFPGLFGMSFPDFVEVYGLEHPDLSLQMLEFLTPHFSSEFAIRPFLLNYPEQTLQTMKTWQHSDNHHVRRLASEGGRPRLPWAMAIPFLKKDPSPILPILETLKDDPEDYVYRSVANNLNDISKDHPELVLQLCKSWKGGPPSRQWVVRHGLRTLLKKGDPKALQLQGHRQDAPVVIKKCSLSPTQICIGQSLDFSVEIENPDKQAHDYRIEYAIIYQKALGKTSRKIFQWKKVRLKPGEKIRLSTRQSMADLSTRKHYPGKHTLQVVINGKPLINKYFQLS